MRSVRRFLTEVSLQVVNELFQRAPFNFWHSPTLVREQCHVKGNFDPVSDARPFEAYRRVRRVE